jgi:hypothetical protein
MPNALEIRWPFVFGLAISDLRDPPALAIVERVPGATLEAPVQHLLRYLRRWPRGSAHQRVVDDVRAMLEQVRSEEAAAGRRFDPLSGQSASGRFAEQVAGIVVDATALGWPVVDMLWHAVQGPQIAAVTVTAGGRVQFDHWGYRVPRQDLVGVVQILAGRRCFRIAPGLPQIDAVTSALGRWVSSAEEAPEALVSAVALALWWGEVGSPAHPELKEGDFSAFSPEALHYEREKRRIRARPSRPDFPPEFFD